MSSRTCRVLQRLSWPCAALCSPCCLVPHCSWGPCCPWSQLPGTCSFRRGPPVASAPLKLLHLNKKEAPHPHPKRLGSKTSLEASALCRAVQMLLVEQGCHGMVAATLGTPEQNRQPAQQGRARSRAARLCQALRPETGPSLCTEPTSGPPCPSLGSRRLK